MCLYIATASHSIPACHYYSYSSRYTKTLKQTFCVRKDSVFRGQISLKVKSNAAQRPTFNLKPKAVQVDVVQGNSSKYKAPMPYLISGDPFIETLLKLHNPDSLIASSHTHRNFWDATRKQMMCVSKVIDITTNYLGPLKIKLEHHWLYICQEIDRQVDWLVLEGRCDGVHWVVTVTFWGLFS